MRKTPAAPTNQAAPVAHLAGRNVSKILVSSSTTELSSPGIISSTFIVAIVTIINTVAIAVSHRWSKYLASPIARARLGQTKVGLVSRGIALLKSHAMTPFRGRCTIISSECTKWTPLSKVGRLVKVRFHTRIYSLSMKADIDISHMNV